MNTPIHFNAFNALAPEASGEWRSPESTRDYLSLSYWQGQAQAIEAAGFDSLFFADLLGLFETRETGHELAVESAMQYPLADPFAIIVSLAAVTDEIGFVISASTTYETPFLLARRFSTLDHFTGGRVGWNVVTSYLDSAAKNFGLTEQVSHEERYARAREFLHVTKRLWLDSVEPGATIKDADTGVYTDPTKVHNIDFEGEYYSVRGPLTTELSPQKSPVIYQATSASPAGIDFAGEFAEGVLTRQPNLETVKGISDSIRARAAEVGRVHRPKLFTDLRIVLAETDLAAQERAEHLAELSNQALSLIGNGIDIRQYPRDTKLSELGKFGTTRSSESLRGTVDGSADVTIEQYLEYGRSRKSPFELVGGPGTVTEGLVKIVEATGVDGFNVSPVPGGYERFAELLTPVLRERGLIREKGSPGTLRDLIQAG